MSKQSSGKNQLSEKQFIFFGLNYVVGFGFIATISKVIKLGVWGILVFAITSLITLAVIYSFARAGQRFQYKVGGSYAYAKRVFGPKMVFFQGWNQISQIILFSSTTPLFLSQLLISIDPDRKWVYILLSLLLYIGLISTGFFGFKLSKWFIFGAAILKWITLGLGMGLIIYLISKSGDYGTTFRSYGAVSVTSIASTILSFIYAYGGFESLALLSGNTKTSRFKKIMLLIFFIILASYFLFYIIFIGLPKDLISSFGLEAVYKYVWGFAGFSVFTVGLLFNRITGTTSSPAPYARMIMPLADDGFLPRPLVKTNKHGEYKNAIVLAMLMAIGSSIIFTIIPQAFGVGNVFEKMLDAGNIAYLVQYLLTIVTIYVWHIKKIDKIPLWERVIYIIGAIAIIFTLIFSQFSFLIGQETNFEEFLPLIAYIVTIILGYIVMIISRFYNKKYLQKHFAQY